MQPITKCRFKVVIAGASGNTSSELSALAIGNLDSTIGVAKMRRGSKSLSSRANQTSGNLSRLRIEFLVGAPGWKDVITWWSDVNDFGKPLDKRNIEVIIHDGEEEALQKIQLDAAWPCRYGFLGASKDAEASSLVQYLEFVAEGFKIAATEKVGGNGNQPLPEPTAKPKRPININFKGADKIDVHDNFKATANIRDALKATGTLAAGGGALSAAGGVLGALLKPAPEIKVSQHIPERPSDIAAPDSAPSEKALAGEPASVTPGSMNHPSDVGKNLAAPTVVPRSPSHAEPVIAVAAVASAGMTTAGIVGAMGSQTAPGETVAPALSDDRKPEADTAPAADDAGYPSGDEASLSTQAPTETVRGASPVGESTSSLASAAAAGLASALVGRFPNGTRTDRTPVGGSLKTEEKTDGEKSLSNPSGTKRSSHPPEDPRSTIHQKDSHGLPSEVLTESGSLANTPDQRLIAEPQNKAEGEKIMRPGESRMKMKSGATPLLTGGSLINQSRRITVFLKTTLESHPLIIVNEEGGESEATIQLIRELIEKDLCAEKIKDRWAAPTDAEYRWCGKLIHIDSRTEGVAISAPDDGLRIAIHDCLRTRLADSLVEDGRARHQL